MAIKAKVIERGTPRPWEYPYIGVSRTTGNVVLFSARSTGVMLRPGVQSIWHTGAHSDAWRETDFTPLVGTLELANDVGA